MINYYGENIREYREYKLIVTVDTVRSIIITSETTASRSDQYPATERSQVKVAMPSGTNRPRKFKFGKKKMSIASVSFDTILRSRS